MPGPFFFGGVGKMWAKPPGTPFLKIQVLAAGHSKTSRTSGLTPYKPFWTPLRASLADSKPSQQA